MTTALIIMAAIATPLGVGCYWFGWLMCDLSRNRHADSDQTACRWRHDWGVYGPADEIKMTEHATKMLAQSRMCKRCNAVDYRRIPMH